MTQTNRFLVAIIIIVILVGAILGVEALRRQGGAIQAGGGEITLNPGDVPIYLNGQLVAGFSPENLDKLEKSSFIDAEEGKTQEGWLLRDVLLLSVAENNLKPDTAITVSSSSRNKSVQLSWTEINQPASMVMFDLSGKGTLKLVSQLEKLNTRDEWIQDTDKIEITGSP
jgi:hypothetical protein